jgi:hypothetical protein
MMNILEEEDFVKGLPDSALMEEAQRPTGTLKQFVVMSEIQRRSKMRKEHEAQLAQGPQSTVKDQIVGEAMQGGIMGAMPPQMAMAPQMAQRMPNMPPQGIQQAMPPQMMSGGGIARMANGGGTGPRALIENVLAQNPDATMMDFLEAGLTEEQAKAYYHLINPSMLDRARAKTPFGRPASEIYPDINLTGIETMVNESDRRRLEQIRSGEKYAQRKAAYDARDRVPVVNDPDAIDLADRQVDILSDPDDLSLLLTDEDRARNTEDALNQRFDQASQRAKRLQAQADPTAPSDIEAYVEKLRLQNLLTDEDRARNQADIREQRKDQFLDNMYGFFGDAYEGATGLVGSGIDSLARSRYGKTLGLYKDGLMDLLSGPPPSANINRDVDDMIAGEAFMDDPLADIDFFDQSIYGGEYKGADLGDGEPSDLAKVTVGQENDRSTPNSILRDILEDQKSADRVDTGDASISGSKYAMGLQDLLDKEIANAANQNKAAMLLTLGGGMIQGKTGEAAEKVAQIATKGAQTQSALNLEGAKMRMRDYRDSQRMGLMLKDILARAGVAESRSDTATLNGVNDAIRQITNTPEYQQELILSRQSGEPGPRMLQLQDLNRARDLLFRKLSPGAFASRQAPTGGDFLELGI